MIWHDICKICYVIICVDSFKK